MSCFHLPFKKAADCINRTANINNKFKRGEKFRHFNAEIIINDAWRKKVLYYNISLSHSLTLGIE